MALTTKKILKLKQPRRYGDGHGLYLQVTPSGVKSWLLRYERGGRERWMGLGPLHTISLQDAREKARKARQQIMEGIDPLDARRNEAAAQALLIAKTITFKECAQLFFDAHERSWRNVKHRQQFRSTLKTYAEPLIGDLPVSAIDTGLVLKVLEPIWHVKTETADRIRNRIESVLDYATVRNYRTGDNPARWKGHLSEVLPARSAIAKSKHHAALPFTDLPEFMQLLSERQGTAARALEFVILTAARTGAVIGATWDEIDIKNRVWTVPATRVGTKISGDQPRRVPLSDRAAQLLETLPRESDNAFVFVGLKDGKGLSNMAMLKQLKNMQFDAYTVHGFRSSFKDWASERTNYPNQVSEAALWHVVADKVEAAYRRGDLFEKRRRLMQDWAKYCCTPKHTGAIERFRIAS